MSTPDLFTVAEAALVLRIGRTTAYELVRRDFASCGGEGLGVVRIGGQFRVPRAALERLVGGAVSWPPGRDGGPAVEDGSATGNVVPLPGAAQAPVEQSLEPYLCCFQCGGADVAVPVVSSVEMRSAAVIEFLGWSGAIGCDALAPRCGAGRDGRVNGGLDRC